MRLKAFRIQSFRSIVDTGFQELSPDNITVLIGQNESGKTSILEALAAFDTNEVTENDLRNDESVPSVTCIMQLEDGELDRILEPKYTIDRRLRDVISRLGGCVALRKVWDINDLEEPTLELENDKLRGYFDDVATALEKDDSTTTDESVAKNPDPGTLEAHDAEQRQSLDASIFAREIYQHSPAITLFEDNSLLPATIDIADLQEEQKDAAGFVGAKNFLVLTGLSDEELAEHQKSERIIGDRIDAANNTLSRDFQQFWSQILGTDDKISLQMEVKNYDQNATTKVGQPYLSFWIKDSTGKQRPMQRSKGVRWFISFFLTLKATAKKSSDRLILIDEPGSNLHAKAQQDILKILESEKQHLQILFATHSPYLLDVSKVYRVIAAERKETEGHRSVTEVFTFQKLGSASNDTLFPLYTNMGVDISHQQVIQKNNNVLLEEISAFFYLKAFWKLFAKRKAVNFLPANGCSNVPLLANLLLGWGIDFMVLVDDDSAGRKVYNDLKSKGVARDAKLIKNSGCDGVEDLFEPSDFTGIVLGDNSEAIPTGTKVSRFVKDKKLPKPVLARDFLIKVENNEIKRDNLSSDTQSRIKTLLDRIANNL